MPAFCTCGAQLPEDARFCHKCGKPQYEFVPEPDEPEQPVLDQVPPPVLKPPAPEISFRNPVAVRIALIASLAGFLGLGLLAPVAGPLAILGMIGGGFLAAYLYRLRTGQAVSVRSGLRIGWITGVFSFVLTILLLTFIVVASTNADLAAQVAEQMKSRDKVAAEMLTTLKTPRGLFDVVLSITIWCGVMPTLGGALGAKVLGRPAQR